MNTLLATAVTSESAASRTEVLANAANVLMEPTPIEMIEWVYSGKEKEKDSNLSRVLFAPYVDARFVINQLMKAFGMYWSKETERVMINANDYFFRTTITVNFGDLVIKRDGVGEDTSIGKFKGGESNSFKRAAVNFGIGIDLYTFPKVYIISEYAPKAEHAIEEFRLITEEFRSGNLNSFDEVSIVEVGFRKYEAYLSTALNAKDNPRVSGERIVKGATYTRKKIFGGSTSKGVQAVESVPSKGVQAVESVPSKGVQAVESVPSKGVQAVEQATTKTVQAVKPATSPREFITDCINKGYVVKMPSYQENKQLRMNYINGVNPQAKNVYFMANTYYIVSRGNLTDEGVKVPKLVNVTAKDAEYLLSEKQGFTLVNL